MSNEKQPMHTCWDPEHRTWLIYLLPEASVPYLTIELDLQCFQEKILENPTFQKFCERMGENLKAIGQMKTQIQQREGGYWPQVISTTSIATTLWIFNNLNVVFNFLRWSTPDKNADGKPNPSRKTLEITVLITSIFYYLLQAALVQIFTYLIFLRMDREKKQNKFFELMREVLKRKPLIVKEIQDKEETINLLIDFLNIGELKLSLTTPQLPIVNIPNFQANKEKKAHFNINQINLDQAQRRNIEAADDEELAVQASTHAALLDLIKIQLDKKNDMSTYHNLSMFIKSLRANLRDETDKEIKEIILCLLKIFIASSYPIHFSPLQLQELSIIGSLGQLISFCQKTLGSEARAPQIPFAFYLAEQLVTLLKEKNILLAANELIRLFKDAGIVFNIHLPNQGDNLLYIIYTNCTVRWQKSKYKAEFIYNYLKSLKPDEYDKVITHIKARLKAHAKSKQISVIIIDIIEELADKTIMNKIVKNSAVSPFQPLSTKKRNEYYGEIQGVTKIITGVYQGRELTFDVYKTLGDGKCGYYSLPIPHDAAGVKQLLLDNIGNSSIRKKLASEMLENLHTVYFPEILYTKHPELIQFREYLIQYDLEMQQTLSAAIDALNKRGINIPDHQFENVYSYLETHSAGDRVLQDQFNILNRFKTDHQDKQSQIVGFLRRPDVCSNYVKDYFGNNGELSFARSSVNFAKEKGLLDAILHVAKPPIHLVIWQSEDGSNEGKIVYEGGPLTENVTHIHHKPGKDTHFELMAETSPTIKPAAEVEKMASKKMGKDHQEGGVIKSASDVTLFAPPKAASKIQHRTGSAASSPSPARSTQTNVARNSSQPGGKKNL